MTTTTSTLTVWVVGASFDRDGRTLSADQPEVCGDPRYYATEEQAQAACDEMQAEHDARADDEDYDLDPSTTWEPETRTLTRREVESLPCGMADWSAEDWQAAGWCRCQCGEWSGEACIWVGPRSETVRVRYVPREHRDTAEAAGTWAGVAETVRVERECGESMVEHDAQWVEVLS